MHLIIDLSTYMHILGDGSLIDERYGRCRQRLFRFVALGYITELLRVFLQTQRDFQCCRQVCNYTLTTNAGQFMAILIP